MPHNRVGLYFYDGVQLGSNSTSRARAVQVRCVMASYFCASRSSFLPADPVISKLVLKIGRFPRLPRVYHKVSKVMSLTLDASMNLYFMRIVQKQLIEPGLNKYKPLVGHNLRIVCIVLLMDVSFEELTVCFGREVMHVIDFIGRYLTSRTN